MDSAITKQQQMLLILQLHKEGMSFSQIGEAVGISKSQAFMAFQEMMRLPIDMDPNMVAVILGQEPEED